MATNVKFLRGIAANLPASRDSQTFYFDTTNNRLYLGEYELTNTGVASDLSALSSRVTTAEGTLTKLESNDQTTGSIANLIATAVAGLAAVARSGNASDVAIADAGSLITGTTVETALQELATAINNLKTASAVTIDGSGTPTTGYLKTYILSQGGTEIGKIDIPKDMVIQSGSVKTVETADVPYSGAVVGDKYIELVLANVDAPNNKLYIPANSLVEYVTGGATTEVTVNVDSSHVVKATLNTGSIAESKLDSSVQTKLGYANSSIQDVAEGTTNGTVKIQVAGSNSYTDIAIHGLGSAAYTASTAYDAAGAAADVLGDSEDTTTDYTVYGAFAKAAAAANDAESAAKSYTDTELGKLDADLDASGTAAHSGTFVMNGVVQTDGKITNIDSVEVEAAGAAAAAQTAAKGYTDTKVQALDANLDATGTAQYSGTFVMSGITEVDGVITAVDSVEVEAAGAAAAAQSAAITAANNYTDTALTWGAFPTASEG